MRRSSLRTSLFFASLLLAVLVVGGVSITTYIVVSEVVAVAAHDAAVQASLRAADIAKVRATDAALEAANRGLTGTERGQEAKRLLFRDVPVMFRGGRDGVEVAFYDENLEPLWFSDERALVVDDEARQRAMTAAKPVESAQHVRQPPLVGLFRPTTLDVLTVHVPIDLPDGTRGIIDVTYFPELEESIMDRVRLPMLVLALSSALVMVVMIQAAVGWILRGIEQLRLAAESIEAGHLEVQLPVEGNHEVANLARSLNLLIGRLRHRAAMQTRFVADASHELATPVAGIRGYTGILRAWGAEDAEVRDEAIAAIDRESRRMARLCGDLLAIVRTDQAGGIEAVPFDVNELARESMASALTRYKHKGIEHAGPPEAALEAVGDPARLEDVISVLLDNAFKYTSAGGVVTIETQATDEIVTIEVSDTGIGIPAEDLPNIFERFYRSDASRSKATGGFGLGLPIAKAAVEAMGGDITVRSAHGEGTTVTVLVPRDLSTG